MIFIVGAGRSGSTVTYQNLCRHPRAAWLSRMNEHFPDKPGYQRAALRAMSVPLVGTVVGSILPPAETYRFWTHHFEGFGRTYRDLTGVDVTPVVEERLSAALARVSTSRRDKLIVKITGWPRVGFLSEIFPEARFVHVVRDGRAVANSIHDVHFWLGWRGPSQWRFGDLPREYEREWDDHDRSFLVLAAIQWKMLVDAWDDARVGLDDDRWMEMRYEDLCSDPVASFEQVTRFCGLPWSDRFESRIESADFTSTNHKWRTQLATHQQQSVEAVLRRHLEEREYDLFFDPPG